MAKAGIMVGCVLLVSACAAPVELPLVSGDDLAPAEASFAPANAEAPDSVAAQLETVQAVADDPEIPRKGFFGRLFGKRNQENPADTGSAAPVIDETPVQVSENAPENQPPADAGASEDTPRRGLFGLFKKRNDPPPETSGASVAAAIENTNPADGVLSEGGDQISAQEAAAMGEPEKPRRGLFGLFGKRQPRDDVPETAQTGTEVASIDPDTRTDAEPPRRGWFGGRNKTSGKGEIPIGTVLPYGQVGVACNARPSKLGKVIDQFKQRGENFTLYDTKPGTLEPRTHYLTGFKDGCARQFTGAMVSLGSPVLHERMRLDSYNKSLAYTETDRAYDKIRKRICKTSGKDLCPQERVAALEGETAFVTIYEQFGSNKRWAEILLNKGKLVAISTR